MYSYTVSLISQFSPFLELSYFSSAKFEIGDVVEVEFNRKLFRALVLKRENLKEVKFDLRNANFKTQKIKSNAKIFTYNTKFFVEIIDIADKNLLSVGEILFYLFNDEEYIISNDKKEVKEVKEMQIYFDNISLEKEKLFNKKLVDIYKPQEFLSAIKSGAMPGIINLHLLHENADVLPTRPHIKQSEVLIIFCKYFLPNTKINIIKPEANCKKFFIDRILNENINSKDKKIEKQKFISDETVNLINENFSQNKKVGIFVWNHGYALRIYCQDCGHYRICPICKGAEQYICEGEMHFTFCKNCNIKKLLHKDTLLLCEYCGSYNLNSFALGVSKVFDYVKEKSEANIVVIDENLKKLSEKSLVKNVNDKDMQILVGTLRAFRAYATQFDVIIIISFGKLDFENKVKISQQALVLKELETYTNKLYIERILSNEEIENQQDPNFVFWENYKKNNLKQIDTDLLTIAIPNRNVKKFLPILSKYKPDMMYKKSGFNIYVFYGNADRELYRYLAGQARLLGDVYVGSVSREFSFTIK